MCGPRLEHSHLSPEVLAQDGLCCPTPHRLATSSASLKNSVSLPGSAGYRRRSLAFKGHPACPPDLPDFHCCTFQNCRLQLPPGAPIRAPQFFRISTGHRAKEENPWQLQMSARISFMRSLLSTTGSFAFATALLFARLAGLTRPEGLKVPPRPPEACTSGLSGLRVTPNPCRISLRRQTENCVGRTFTCKHSS